MFSNIYNNRSVLLTGHTGFKGSWLALWLRHLHAAVTGFSLAPETSPNHWDLLNLSCNDLQGDIRDFPVVRDVLQSTQPEIVFHLAAQPLVRRSYADPLETWSTNVLGTVNVLEACRSTKSVKAIIVVTTDKCYENREQTHGYQESDRLGGHDPYSASKAAAELVAACYRKSYFNSPERPLLATARAGNVIGGGDWAVDRLIPDAARAVSGNQSLEIRSPNSTRPWQHVLECLAGYLLLGQHLLQGHPQFADAWNFGPGPEGNQTVSDVLNCIASYWPDLRWHTTSAIQPHETTLLQLDSTKAHKQLGWRPVWNLSQALEATAIWYHQFYKEQNPVSRTQLLKFISDANTQNHEWALS